MKLKLKLSGILLIAGAIIFTGCGGSSGSSANPDSAESGAKTTFNIVYNGNGNTEGSVPVDGTVYKAGDTVTVAGNTGTLGTHAANFAGWNTKADGTGTSYAEGETFAISSSDVTLYADWGTWTRLYGTAGNTYTKANGICTDSSGNTYTTGTTFIQGSDPFSYSIGMFLIKYNTYGEKQWTSYFVTTGVPSSKMCTDSEGNVYITGYTNVALDGETLTGKYDAFVMKFDTNGNKIWTKEWGVADMYTYGNGICTDAMQNIYITGSANCEKLDGTGSVAFVMKCGKDGNESWTKLLSIWAITSGSDIAVDASSDSLYICGSTAIGQPTSADNNGDNGFIEGEDAFIAKYKMSTGEMQWTTQFGSSTIGADGFLSGYYLTTGAGNIAIDSSGSIFIAGGTSALLDGTCVLAVNNSFVAKYNSSGEKQWVRQSGSWGANTRGYGFALDSGGNAYVAGDTNGPLDGQVIYGTDYAFVMKYDTNGNKQWTKLMGIPDSCLLTEGRGIAIDPNDKIYVTGFTSGNLDGETLNGSYDAFVTTWFNK